MNDSNRKDHLTFFQNEPQLSTTFVISSSLFWIDPRLRWDPTSWDNITGVTIKPDTLWVPDVWPCSSISTTATFYQKMSAQLSFNGSIRLDVKETVSYHCKFNFSRFPMDVQACNICYGLDGHSSNNPLLLSLNDRPNMISNTEWTFGEGDSGTITEPLTFRGKSGEITTSQIGYRIIIRRNSEFWTSQI
ncbi:hypothetical protein PENTCL1PPCAC_870, partial [Pristionchus entomophagus]